MFLIEIHAKIVSLEIGKPIIESRLEVSKCVWVLKYFAEALTATTIKIKYFSIFI